MIDQWALYADAPITAILPITFADDGSVKFTGFAGLGVYGGIVTGTLAAWWYTRRRKVSFARWADIVAPALFVMQAIGRWGNYFNQELYGPPTTQPWGIAIDCAHRLASLRLRHLPGDDAVPPAVPVRIDLGAARCGVPRVPGVSAAVAAAPR